MFYLSPYRFLRDIRESGSCESATFLFDVLMMCICSKCVIRNESSMDRCVTPVPSLDVMYKADRMQCAEGAMYIHCEGFNMLLLFVH